jgi:hypothetical protein
VELRHQCCTLRRIARQLAALITTLARAMRRLDPKPSVQRYEWERPGEMIAI